jgi:elongation factor Ts
MAEEIELVKKLREMTGVSIIECQKAVKESNGDLNKAIEILRKRGLAEAAKKALREAGEGIIASYVHTGNKIGVLVELNCETDFVARNEEFINLGKEIAMQIAAANPKWISKEDVDEKILSQEKEIYAEHARKSGKPESAIPKIVEGKLKKFYEENCLLEQPYIRDTSKKVSDLLAEAINKFGENIVIRRFVRFRVNEE